MFSFGSLYPRNKNISLDNRKQLTSLVLYPVSESVVQLVNISYRLLDDCHLGTEYKTHYSICRILDVIHKISVKSDTKYNSGKGMA